MKILSIETSCDDTCAAIVEMKNGKCEILKNISSSQISIHKKYGGVVPEIAARGHIESIIPVIDKALRGQKSIRAVAVASGPGLITSLLVGVETAKAISFAWKIPIIKINHVEGHIYSVILKDKKTTRKNTEIKFPAIALVASGGHTELILMQACGKYKLIGKTRDDAAGEAFDKSAKMLGLPYPGGPEISTLAKKGNPRSFEIPRPMLGSEECEFSFSGMKNAIRLTIESLKEKNGKISPRTKQNLCASIEQAIVDVLVEKSSKAIKKYNPRTFILSGGVSANKKLRQTFHKIIPKRIKFLTPNPKFCTDNAAMIGAAAVAQINRKKINKYDNIKAQANWELV